MQQYKSNDSPIIKQLDLSFIQHSLDRLDVDDRLDLLPIALAGFAADEGKPRVATMFNFILRMILDVRIPPRGSKDDEAFRKNIGLENEADAKFLATCLGVFLRLRTPSTTQTLAQCNPTLSAAELALFPAESAQDDKIFKRVSELKSKTITLLASAAFTDEEKFLPALLAAASPDNRVGATAEEILKRSSVSMEDETLVTKLFEAHSRLPAANRTRILSMLSKSALSTTMTTHIMNVVSLDFVTDETQSLKPVSALEKTKLHKALFQYLSWVAQVGPTKQKFTIGSSLITHMKTYVEGQGWPVPQVNTNDDLVLRSKAYETIGLLARSADMPLEDRFSLAAWLFRSLSEDTTAEAVVNIDGALSSLTANIPVDEAVKNSTFKSMLLTYMSLTDDPPAVRSTRHAVVKWANECLPFSDVQARWIDILAIGGRANERSDVVEQGHKGLDPWTYFAHSQSKSKLPDWKEMTMNFFESIIEPHQEATPESAGGLPTLPNKAIFSNFQGSRISAFPTALRYCKQIMFLSALQDFTVQPDWMQQLDAQVKTDITTKTSIRAYLRDIESSYLVFYLKACLEGATVEDSPIVEDCIRCFVDVASLSPGGAIGYLAKDATDMLKLIKSNNKEIRALGSRALAILAAHPSNHDDYVSNISKTLEGIFANASSAVGPDLNAAEGALLAYGYLHSRRTFYHRQVLSGCEFPLKHLVDDKTSASLQEAALDSVSQLWSARLALPASDGDYSVVVIIKALAELAKKGNEKAITALGRLATGLNDPTASTGGEEDQSEAWKTGLLGSILEALFSLHEIKRVEVHFTVGDAITAAIARWDSDCVKLTMDVDCRGSHFQNRSHKDLIAQVLTKLFTDCKSTKPSLLKASGIWLFCIVQYCSHLDEVQSRLREAQSSFMRLLNARDELVQETASRGLSLAYEKGDAELKSALVKDLVSAFTGSGTQLKVDEDTELFDAGALPTGEGKSITSYKDIVNLANEVGDQRLVYKFMSLAANAATWSTRSAFGRFGLSNILSESEVDPKLYPKLFRYRFDPNSNVQRSMDDIWKSLVKDSNATIETYFDDILEDLLKSILGKEWRMREASCAAISDLIQGRPFVRYEKSYRDIWTSALKVLDDVKGSVREAALRLCMALSNGLVRQLEDGNHSAAAKAMMNEALPFLLSDKGIESSVQDVQIFATITIMKIAKKGGVALKPFVADIVPQLLGLLSTIEPEQINYHYQRAGEESRDKIDKLRSQMVNQSPISEAIDNCLRFVDTEVITDLAPRLEGTIKTAIGMPTKIGCSRVLTTLFTRHTTDIKPVSARFLKLLEKQTQDKNDEVSQAYARAAAYIMRVVDDADKLKFCSRMVDLYFDAEDEARRAKIADVVMALAKISPDHFTSQEATLLPFSYVGSKDVDEYTSKAFREVWDQHAGSSRTVMRYVPEITALVDRCLSTTQWSIRHTGAFAVATMAADVASASEATGNIGDANCKTIWPVFDKALALKTFPGKERVLEGFPKFVERSSAFWGANDEVAGQMKKVALREAKRNNEDYRPHAFKALWQFAAARSDLDLLSDITDIVKPYLNELKDEDKMDVDSKEDATITAAKNGLEAIARGYTRSKSRDAAAILDSIIAAVQDYLPHEKFASIKREVWYGSVKDLMKDLSTEKGTLGQVNFDAKSNFMAYLSSLDLDKAETGTLSQRLERTNAVLSMLDAKASDLFGDKKDGLIEAEKLVQKALVEERSLDVQRAWRKVLETMSEAK